MTQIIFKLHPLVLSMSNSGKLWSIDDDQKLMESPELSDGHFAQNMGRTEHAIRCRRNHIAGKMHQNSSCSSSLSECVQFMRADYAQVSTLLMEWTEKRANIKRILDNKRQRQMEAPLPLPPPPPMVASAASLQPAGVSDDSDDSVTFICKRICDDGGNFTSLWNTPHLLPCLVRHYHGFEAYARVVRVLAAQG